MWLLFLEACIALFLLIFIVVWTMAGRTKVPPRPLRAPHEMPPPSVTPMPAEKSTPLKN